MPKKRYIIIASAAVISLTAAFFMSGKPAPKNDIISESTVYSNIESRDESCRVLSSVSEQISEKEYSFESSVSVSESSSSSKAEESSAQEISEDEPSVQEKSEVSEISADEQSVQDRHDLEDNEYRNERKDKEIGQIILSDLRCFQRLHRIPFSITGRWRLPRLLWRRFWRRPLRLWLSCPGAEL